MNSLHHTKRYLKCLYIYASCFLLPAVVSLTAGTWAAWRATPPPTRTRPPTAPGTRSSAPRAAWRSVAWRPTPCCATRPTRSRAVTGTAWPTDWDSYRKTWTTCDSSTQTAPTSRWVQCSQPTGIPTGRREQRATALPRQRLPAGEFSVANRLGFLQEDVNNVRQLYPDSSYQQVSSVWPTDWDSYRKTWTTSDSSTQTAPTSRWVQCSQPTGIPTGRREQRPTALPRQLLPAGEFSVANRLGFLQEDVNNVRQLYPDSSYQQVSSVWPTDWDSYRKTWTTSDSSTQTAPTSRWVQCSQPTGIPTGRREQRPTALPRQLLPAGEFSVANRLGFLQEDVNNVRQLYPDSSYQQVSSV